MKIKNKLRYIFIFCIVLALLFSLSINIFAYTWSYYAYYDIPTNQTSAILNINNAYLVYNNVEYIDPDNSYSIYFFRSSSTLYIYLYDYIDTDNFHYIDIVDSGNSTVGADLYIKFFTGGTFKFTYNNKGNLSGYGTKIISGNTYNFIDQGALWLKCVIGTSYYNTRIRCDVVSSSPLSKSYDIGSFYNNNTLYNQIIVDGISLDNSTFTSITSISYKNSNVNYQAVAYSNSAWTSGYNSNLQYFWNGTAPTVSSINSDLNSLITFSTSVIATDLDKTYNLDFRQNGSSYNNIRVVGTTINGTNFNSIQSIDYNSDQVYINNNFVSGFSNYLGYTFTPPDSTILSNLNSDLGGLLVFYTVHVNPTPEEKFFHDIDVSTNGILTIVYAFANNLLSNILLITMCIALPLVSFAVVQVIRIYKIKKGQ